MKGLTTRHPAALALLAGAAVAAAVPVGSAVAADSPPAGVAVEVVSAEVVAKGAAADVTVTYVCSYSYYDGRLTVDLAQRSGSEVTSGSGSTNVTCDGVERTAVVRVAAANGSRAFKKGVAAVSAYLDTCGWSFCGTVSDSEEISLRR